jgi:poly(3-hydroxybutyrate) depolymerase
MRLGGGVVMRYMLTYDLMESMRNTNQWLGATARAMAPTRNFLCFPTR